MNTPAIKPILDHFKAIRDAVDLAQHATNTEERERIAELERDLAHEKARASHETDGAMQYLRLIEGSTLDEKVREVIRQRDEARANLAQSASIVEATLRSQLATYQTATAGTFGGVPVVEVKPLVEEQGPWVVMRHGEVHRLRVFATADDQEDFATDPDRARRFNIHDAHRACAQLVDDCGGPWSVITLAEARALAKVTP